MEQSNRFKSQLWWKQESIFTFFSNGDEYKLVPIIGEELDFIDPNTDVQVSFTTNENTATFTLYGQTEIKL